MREIFTTKVGEIDIIAYDVQSNEIVFIEVKTRANNNYGLPSEAVDNNKLGNIIYGMKLYLHRKKWENKYIRVDVLELFYRNKKFQINHIKQVI